jgi:hypothetical protein
MTGGGIHGHCCILFLWDPCPAADRRRGTDLDNYTHYAASDREERT